ncbi:hypothetical protein Y5W_02280 [Alcanivorax sp. 521-1]|uniref:Uncharacterized protein n=1 Tax=Alloalcanivorax profundimaris TaxID=2735259 RepID=A0ABS0AS66_9GAMM|nr:hypothetical protein [Alloalcanivorax profundimaris]MBF5056986.1 hypothetical protein [Alloalcanivorax profundimaris]
MTTFTLRRTPLAVAVCSAILCAPTGADNLFDDAAPARDLYTAGAGYDFNGFDVTALPDGQFAVVWVETEDSGETSYVKLARFNAEGDAVGEALTVEESDSAHDAPREPVVAAGADGDMVVAWESRDAVRNLECDSVSYKLVSHENTVSDGISLGSGDLCRVRAAMNDDGAFVLAGYERDSEGQPGDYLAWRFSANGTKINPGPIYMGQGNEYVILPPAVTMQGDTFTLAWNGSQGRLLAQRYNVNGTALSDSFRLDNDEQSGPSVSQTYPTLAGDEEGGFVGFWYQIGSDGEGGTDDHQLGHRWAADGTAVAALEAGEDAIRGNVDERAPISVATDGDGLILAGWSFVNIDAERMESRVAAFRDGQRLGDGPMTVATTGEDTDVYSDLTRVVISGGTATVLWYQREPGENAVIRARSVTVSEPAAEEPASGGEDNGGGGSSGGASGPLVLLGLGLLALRRRLR